MLQSALLLRLPMDLPVSLLGLARAVSWDGGDEIVRELQRILADAAPFDGGAAERASGTMR